MSETHIKEGEIVVEADHPKDTRSNFYPANELIRNRWTPQKIGLKQPVAYFELPIEGIPGQRVHLDVKGRIGRITDPLRDEKNEGLFEQIKRVDKSLRSASKMPVLPENVRPCREIRFENLTDEQIVTWKFWMRQMVDGKRDFAANYKNPDVPIKVKSHGRLLQGKLPTQVELIRTGMVRRPSYRRGNFLDRDSRYVDPPKEILELAEKETAKV